MCFILPHEAKALLEIFCLKPNAFASWGKIHHSFLALPKFNKAVFVLPSEAGLLKLFCR